MSDGSDLSGRLLAGRYRVQAVLARGALATVYTGTDETLARQVAIKAVPPAHADAYARALEATAALTYPSVLMTMDAVAHQGWLVLVQELVPQAAPLAQRLAAGLAVNDALELGAQLCRALAYAHTRGIVHGDMTPAAVLLDGAGAPHLTNFGLPADGASRVRVAEIEAQLAQGLGLPAPAANEQEPSAAGDVQAVGALLWQALSAPEGAGGAQELRPEVPGKVSQMLARLIVHSHPERLADAAAAALAIEARLREVEVAQPRSTPTTPPAVRAARERRASAPEAEWSTAETQVLGTAWSAQPQTISAASLIESDVLGVAPTVPMAAQPPLTAAPPSNPAIPRQMPPPLAAPPSGPITGPQWPPMAARPSQPGPATVPPRAGPPSGPIAVGALSGPLRPIRSTGPLRSGLPSGPLTGRVPSRPLPTGALRASPSSPMPYRPQAPLHWSDDPALARWAAAGGKRARRSLGVTQVLALGVLLFVLAFLVTFMLR
jgi:serine/threonine protein kinase